MIRVYTASKLEEYKRWLKIQKEHPGVFFHARWIKHMEIGTPDRADRAQEFWLQDQEDVESADVVLLYETGGRVLKGALVEAGMAIAKGIPVIVVGDEKSVGNWVYHPGVTLVATLDDALKLLDSMSVGWRQKHSGGGVVSYKEVFVPYSEMNNAPWTNGAAGE